MLHNPTWWQKTSWSVIALGLPAQVKQIHGCDRTMDTGACAYWATSELNAGCEPLCLVASSTTLPQCHAAFFLYCVDYVIETCPWTISSEANYVVKSVEGIHRLHENTGKTNPNLLQKHKPRGSHGSRAGGGSKKSSNFMSPSTRATPDSQSSKHDSNSNTSGHHDW